MDLIQLKEVVKPEHSAVIMVDFQNDFCHPEGVFGKGGDTAFKHERMQNAKEFLEVARQNKVLVIFLKTNHNRWNSSPAWMRHKKDRPMHCRDGTWGEEFYMVKPLENEPVVVKHRFSGFIGTDLDQTLRSQGIQTLIMTGGGTHACVESTARDGFMLDYDIVLLSDCTFTSSPKRHYTALEVMGELFATVVSSKEVADAWAEEHLAARTGTISRARDAAP